MDVRIAHLISTIVIKSTTSMAGHLVRIIKRLYNGSLNQRNLVTLPINFAINFSPIFLWLAIFKNAGLVPIDIRPSIHSKAAFFLDVYLFGDHADELFLQLNDKKYRLLSFISSFAFMVVFLVLFPLAIWYYIYYIKRVKTNVLEWNEQVFHFSNGSNPKRFRTLAIPFLLPLVSFLLLNIDSLFALQRQENFAKWKDMLAWFSYVIMHLTAPILTAVYLYVFQPPGTLKCFAFALGFQNLMGVTTHLLLPMAPPWFTHLYGIYDTKHVNYTQEGYAAGLTRVDAQLGTHLNTSGFHMSPIVFGAVPSLHSAMAFQCFLFLITRSTTLKNRFASAMRAFNATKDPETLELTSLQDSDADADSSIACEEESDTLAYVKYYDFDAQFANKWYFALFNKAVLPRLLGTAFIILQWWATMYLDHHYRFDLFIGMLYALLWHIVVNSLILQPRVLAPWVNVRLGEEPDSKNEGRTMGMRVFANTRLEWFFDPLA